jgi:hypothetical protein
LDFFSAGFQEPLVPVLPSSTYPSRRGRSRRASGRLTHQVPAAPLALEPVEAEVVLPSFRIRRKLE